MLSEELMVYDFGLLSCGHDEARGYPLGLSISRFPITARAAYDRFESENGLDCGSNFDSDLCLNFVPVA